MATDQLVCYRHPDQETRLRCTRCDRPICTDCMHPAPVGHHCPECVAEGRKAMRVRRGLPRPRSLTIVLLGIQLAVFAIELGVGATRDIGKLADLGGMVPILVADGQWWRLLTAIFLHASLFHLLFNAYALFLFGSIVEGWLGTLRFAAVYLITGFVGSAASYAFGSTARVSVGASGAIFGLLGAFLAYNWRRRNLSMAQGNLRFALLLIGINLVIGFSSPGIDNAAHLGGLAAGIVAGLAAEGVGVGRIRTATKVLGLASVAVAGVALVVWRTSVLL